MKLSTIDVICIENAACHVDKDKEQQCSKSRSDLSKSSAPKKSGIGRLSANSGDGYFDVGKEASVNDPRYDLEIVKLMIKKGEKNANVCPRLD